MTEGMLAVLVGVQDNDPTIAALGSPQDPLALVYKLEMIILGLFKVFL